MATDIVIPNVGESVTEGLISAWLKNDGDWVEQDEALLELETDKVTMEVPAPAAGVLKRSAAEGDTVPVGSVVGSVDESAEKPAGASSESSSKPEPAKKQESGSSQAANGSPSGGGTATAAPPAPEPKPQAPVQRNGDVRATPLAEKIASEFGVDLSKVTATGAGHRVREQDVIAFLQAKDGAAPATSDGGSARSRESSRQSMSPLRQRIATRLVEAQQTAAMLTTFNEIDMTASMALRKQYKDAFAEKHGVNLGFMSFFVAAAVSALKKFPLVNAYIVDNEGKPAIEKHEYCDIAIAVSSPKGLVVPVLRNAEAMGFAEIESTIKDFAVRAKDGKLDLSEMQGGTFTITNGGVFGSLLSTPILNPPQSAILGMHAIKNRAVEDPDKPGQVALRPMMYVALSYDHRIVDGAEAVSFLKHIKECVEDPTRLLLAI
ncbi:MAG: 2-oxoglutarate dehydrogenase complex dihydrolipoyllysine-residue succinyltransferase [Phycisphaerales bacterium JB037]